MEGGWARVHQAGSSAHVNAHRREVPMTEPDLLTRCATPVSWHRLYHLVGACLSALLLFLLTVARAYASPTVNVLEDRTSPVLPRAFRTPK